MRIRGIEAIKNLGRVYFAQTISFGLTIIMTLYTPSFLGVTQFSYWQLFLLYTSYAGLMQLGLNDGIYLRYGGKKLTHPDKQILSGQFFVFVAILSSIFSLVFFTFSAYSKNTIFIWLCLLICIYGLISNINGYLVYLLQSTNMIKVYAYSVIVDRSFLIVAILTLGFIHCEDYIIVAIIYIIGTIIADIIMILKSNRAVTAKFKINKLIFIEIYENIKAGFPLMLSGIASSLIIGICRFMISDHYPIETFGIVSLSFTLTVFVLGFISQIGMVIYPFLKNKDYIFHRNFFPKIDYLIEALIPYSFIILPILIIVISYYLPKYIHTIPYLIIIFPLCLFETQNAILLNTYMKVFRKERKLLAINTISFIVSLTLCYIAIYIIDSISFALISVTASIVLKSQIMRNIISKRLDVKSTVSYNIILTILYYLLYFFNIKSFIIVGIIILFNSIILLINRKTAFDAVKIFISRSKDQ